MNIIPIAHQENYSKILKHINAYKNGITSDTMTSYGVHYDKNFGVSMVDLKRVADRFDNNAELAQLLWDKRWRETYLLSTLLDQPATYTLHKLQQRTQDTTTYELLEQLAYNIAWQLPFLDEHFSSINTWNLHQQYFLIKCTMYQLMKKKIDGETAWNRIKQYDFQDNVPLLSTLQNLLLHITSTNPNCHLEVVTYCNNHNTDTWQILGEVIKEYGI